MVNDGADEFPGVDDQALRRPPQGNEPRERTGVDGVEIKWCGECGAWGDHYRSEHPAEVEDAANLALGCGINEDARVEVSDDEGVFSRLRAAGLI